MQYAALLSCQYCSLCMCCFTSVSWQINDDDDDDDDDDDMFSDRASPGPTGRRTYSTCETQLLGPENGF